MMIKMRDTGLSFMKSVLGAETPLTAPIFVSEDGDYYLFFETEEMGEKRTGYYKVLSKIIHGASFKMRWHSLPIDEMDVEIVDEF